MCWVLFVAIKHNPHVQTRKLQRSISNSTIEGDLEGRKMMFKKVSRISMKETSHESMEKFLRMWNSNSGALKLLITYIHHNEKRTIFKSIY